MSTKGSRRANQRLLRFIRSEPVVLGAAFLITSMQVMGPFAAVLYAVLGKVAGFITFAVLCLGMCVASWLVAPLLITGEGENLIARLISRSKTARIVFGLADWIGAAWLGPLLAPQFYRYLGVNKLRAVPTTLVTSLIYALAMFSFGGGLAGVFRAAFSISSG